MQALHELKLPQQGECDLFEGTGLPGERGQLSNRFLVIREQPTGERVFEVWLQDGLLERQRLGKEL